MTDKEERATERAIAKDEKAKAAEEERKDADPQRMEDAVVDPDYMYKVASSQQHPPVPADRSDPGLEPMAAPEVLPMSFDPDSYVVLVTQMGNDWLHGMVVSGDELRRNDVDIDDRVAIGAIVRLDSDDGRIPAARESYAARSIAERRHQRDMGVAR